MSVTIAKVDSYLVGIISLIYAKAAPLNEGTGAPEHLFVSKLSLHCI